MTTRKIVLWCCILVLLASPVAAYQYWEEFLQMMGIQVALVEEYPPVADLPPPTPAIRFPSELMQKKVEALQEQSLDESFDALLKGQMFSGLPHIPRNNRPEDMNQVLGNRIFLKVFQQVLELPKEQALEKLHQFSEKAIKGYENALGLSMKGRAAQEENPTWSVADIFEKLTGRFSIQGAKNALWTTMLLAARSGEYELLIHQIDTMWSLADEYYEKTGEDPDSIYHLIIPLEDDSIFTVLMYALKVKEGEAVLEDIDISPFFVSAGYDNYAVYRQQREDAKLRLEAMGITAPTSGVEFRRGTALLYRWDAYVIPDDQMPFYLNPNDLVEQIPAYSFSSPWFGGSGREDNIQIQLDRQMRIVLESLKERLSK